MPASHATSPAYNGTWPRYVGSWTTRTPTGAQSPACSARSAPTWPTACASPLSFEAATRWPVVIVAIWIRWPCVPESTSAQHWSVTASESPWPKIHGEGVDIDAPVDAYADAHAGLEMTDRLFTRLHKDERNIAVMLMVDMSGSTKGWINDAEREAIILLSEALETLGDRFAIYGFSGWTRKRCEAYPVKRFDQPYDVETKARICGIGPRDYTRMGAPIRHLTRLLREQEVRTKLLITLSDGKPDDYDHQYRGEYGIEDTRQALFEARRDGVHPFCITIDEEGADYLPHMYGPAGFAVIADVAKLPLKVSDIYRRLTS